MTTEEAKKRKGDKKLSKDVLNVIRTTMRNNIELTHIADNKANVLLSLNALMITFLVPFSIPYFEVIKQYRLGFPLMILILTCFVVIYISALVLKPGKFFENQKDLGKGRVVSPFFFGNFYKMDKKEFREYFKEAVSRTDLVKSHIANDMHYIGSRLGRKMTLIRIAFNIFMLGLFGSMTISILMLFIHSK